MAARRGRGRPRMEDKLMDDAIRHFAPMGYAEPDIRSTVQQLIEVFGREGLKFLREDHYRVVQDALFEKQEQEEQLQLRLEQEEPNKQKEAEISEAPVESDMPMVEVHKDIPAEAKIAVEGADPMLIDLPAPEATMTRSAVATGSSRARRPCYGWISES